MQQFVPVIRRLARQYRHRLWLTDLLRHAYLPLGWVALVLLVAGIIHQGFIDLAVYPVVLLACIPLMLCVLPALKTRPSLATSVTQADLQLQAHSLFIAAWELSISPPADSNVQPLIMARVENQLPLWRKQLDRQAYPRPDTAFLITLSLTVIGGFLLLLPGKPASIMHEPVARQDAQADVMDIPDPVAVINEILLQEKHEMHAAPKQNSQNYRPDKMQQEIRLSNSSQTEQQESATTESLVGLKGRERQSGPEQSNIGMPPQPSPQSQRHRPGRSSGRDNPHTSSVDQLQASSFLQQQAIVIAIDGQSEARAFNPLEGGRLTQGKQQEASSDQAFTQAQPAVDSSGLQLALNRISPEQRALVIRYFEQLSQSNETTP